MASQTVKALLGLPQSSTEVLESVRVMVSVSGSLMLPDARMTPPWLRSRSPVVEFIWMTPVPRMLPEVVMTRASSISAVPP